MSPGVSASVAAGVVDAPGVLLGIMDVVGRTVDVAVGVVLFTPGPHHQNGPLTSNSIIVYTAWVDTGDGGKTQRGPGCYGSIIYSASAIRMAVGN